MFSGISSSTDGSPSVGFPQSPFRGNMEDRLTKGLRGRPETNGATSLVLLGTNFRNVSVIIPPKDIGRLKSQHPESPLRLSPWDLPSLSMSLSPISPRNPGITPLSYCDATDQDVIYVNIDHADSHILKNFQ